MDFAATVAFLILYYIRPQEWIPLVGVLRPVTLTMGLALGATLLRKAGFTWKELFKTPHDGLMLAYLLWIVVTARNPLEAFSAVYNLYAIYVVTLLALSNLERIGKYLVYWAGLIVTIAALGVASTLGFDPMGSREITEGAMEGRLALGTLIFDNANALGHSVVPVLPMLYVLLVWRRPIFVSAAAVPLMAIPAYCVYLTLSKGAYLSGFVTGLISLCFRRSKIVQGWILAAALTLGVAGLQQLPRMSTMGNTKGDEGIQRRSAAFQFGYNSMRENLTGLGYNRFSPKMESRGGRLVAGPHSSYVRVGGEFGVPGLFLFCSILFTCYRTLYAARTTRVEEERVLRVLLVLLVSFTFSSWMMDWSLMAHFVLMVAAVASFHRYLLRRELIATLPASEAHPATTMEIAPAMTLDVGAPTPTQALNLASLSTGSFTSAGSRSERRARRRMPERIGIGPGRPLWNRLRLVDFGMFGVTTLLVLLLWRYAMNSL